MAPDLLLDLSRGERGRARDLQQALGQEDQAEGAHSDTLISPLPSICAPSPCLPPTNIWHPAEQNGGGSIDINT